MNLYDLENLILDDVVKRFEEYRAANPDNGNVVHVPAGGDLQAALDTSPIVELEAGATYAATRYTISKPTQLRGNGAMLRGDGGPALYIRPGTHDVQVQDVVGAADYGCVFQAGDNTADTQGRLEDVPTRIVFTRCGVPSHRGKRAFEINASADLIDCEAYDVWIAGQDSQGVCLLNTPGPVRILGGCYEAASENILIGGDSMKLPAGTVCTDVRIDGVRLTKPDAWQTDGTKRDVKNLLEVKAGVDVQILNCVLDHCWKDAQDGYAIVITPRNAQLIRNVTIDGCTITRVSAGLQLLGVDNATVTPAPTCGIAVRNSSFDISKALYGARGILALLLDGVQDATFDRVSANFDGDCMFQADTDTPIGPIVMRASTMPTGKYGCMAPGVNYGGPTPPDYVGRDVSWTFDGNTFTDAPSKFQSNYPNNTYETSGAE